MLDSRNPNFQTGDLVWGMTGWEEYSLITSPQLFFKIEHTDVPLSYYTGILGKLLCCFRFIHNFDWFSSFANMYTLQLGG